MTRLERTWLAIPEDIRAEVPLAEIRWQTEGADAPAWVVALEVLRNPPPDVGRELCRAAAIFALICMGADRNLYFRIMTGRL